MSDTTQRRPAIDTQQMPNSERNDNRSNAPRYVLTIVSCLILAAAVFAISRPEEKTGPPQPTGMAQGNGMPEDHPHTGEGTPTDQQAVQDRFARLEQIEEAMKQDPDDPGLLLQRGNVLYDLGQLMNEQGYFEQAIVAYRAYLDQDPSNADVQTDLAYSEYRTGKIEEAIALLQKVQADFPTHQNSSFNLALMYKEKDLPDSVLYYMELTASIDSTSRPGKAAQQILNEYRNAH